MLCDVCKKRNATYHSRSSINGRVSEVHLCEHCLEQSHYNPLSVFTRDLFGFETSIDRLFDVVEHPTECSTCGTKFNHILNTGRVGCGDCYRQYKDSLSRLIQSLNNADSHIGKSIESKSIDEKASKIRLLEKKLKEAVATENYEEAAVIKKQILALKEDKDNEK